MKNIKKITYNQFIETYKPVMGENNIIKSYKPNTNPQATRELIEEGRIWTLLGEEKDYYITNGLVYKKAIDYLVTLIPYHGKKGGQKILYKEKLKQGRLS